MEKKKRRIMIAFLATGGLIINLAIYDHINRMERENEEKEREIARQVSPWKALAERQAAKIRALEFNNKLHEKTLARLLGGEDPALLFIETLSEFNAMKKELGESESRRLILEQSLADALFDKALAEELLGSLIEVNMDLVLQNLELIIDLAEAQETIERLRGERGFEIDEPGEEKTEI